MKRTDGGIVDGHEGKLALPGGFRRERVGESTWRRF